MITDLHCDLLCYLAHDAKRTPYDAAVRCSIPQLLAGPVSFQILPIFTSTEPESVKDGINQLETYHTLSKKYPVFGTQISTRWAIENGSALVDEKEHLDRGFERLEAAFKMHGNPAYISFTWNGENRFGGGAATPEVGLKSDGRELLRFLHGRGIAIDFSHASDPLAYAILAQIDRENLTLPVMASHSNFRAVCDVSRNLPDDLALEIFKRGGVIGLNFVRMFVGPDDPIYFAKQLEHGLSLGGEDHLCIGADFFYGLDVPADARKSPDVYWFPDHDNAACYGEIFKIWKEKVQIAEDVFAKITTRNFECFSTISTANPL